MSEGKKYKNKALKSITKLSQLKIPQLIKSRKLQGLQSLIEESFELLEEETSRFTIVN